MSKRTIGSFAVMPIGLGCMNVSFGYGAADENESRELLLQALDNGVDFFDTAHLYGGGHNEVFVGNVLAPHRQRFVLASKCGLSTDGINGQPAVITAQCDTSLQRLQTDVIDLYYLHRVDPEVPIEDSVGALADLVKAGKIREIGLSEISCETLARAQAVAPIAAVQSEYSLWSRTPERGMLEACRQSGTTFVPFSPLGRGFLAGSASDVNELPEDDLRATIARPRFEPDAFSANEQLLVRFAEIANDQQCTMAQLALAWLLHQSDQTLVPIPGTRNVQHMLDNAAAVNIDLASSTLEELDNLINDETVVGTRYSEARMRSTDSEKDG